MRKVFVSGCYDIVHGGHVEFFRQARALGDYLIVCLPSDDVLFHHKKRRPFIPLSHKIHLLRSLREVDEVVIGDDAGLGLNFRSEFLRLKPQFLAVTEDDGFEAVKRALCREVGAEYVQLPKTLDYEPISTTQIYERIRAPAEAPVRVDFAGGSLDVPRLARPDGYIVNCTVTPMVSLTHWPYQQNAGLGGSGAYALLCGRDAIAAELDNNVGWQDPAVIMETGLCVWKSGARPVLEAKLNPGFLKGRLAIHWTGAQHVTNTFTDRRRDYDRLARGGQLGRAAALACDFARLCEAVNVTHEVQLGEGMAPLRSFGEQARKYCGGGHGGYAVYLFEQRPDDPALIPIEPYMKRFAGW